MYVCLFSMYISLLVLHHKKEESRQKVPGSHIQARACKQMTKNWNGPLQVGHTKMEIQCDCREQTHNMDHLLKYPMLPQECTTEDLMEYNVGTRQEYDLKLYFLILFYSLIVIFISNS